IRAAFCRAFVGQGGRIRGDTQAGYALALQLGLLPPALEEKAAAHMVRALRAYGGHLSTGIQSTVRMMLELARFGYLAEAYGLLLKRTIPSWGYMVEHGGTTVWERWDGWVEGRGFQNPGMNSFNHYAIGAVGEFVYRVVLGLNPDEEAPGWRHFTVRPLPPPPGVTDDLTWARGSYRSVRGTIGVEWRIEEGEFRLEVEVPANTTATVVLPGGRTRRRVGSGRHRFAVRAANGTTRPRGRAR
ncbi:MAG: alpha-L-rhamnosidase C-terminal domain-containing protein, partial [Candidatus Latescibacterota bacterium]